MPIYETEQTSYKPIDVGIVVLGHIPANEKAIIDSLPNVLTKWLKTRFKQFQWRFRITTLPCPQTALRQEPAFLLDEGARLRDLYQWDLGIVITPSDLVCRYKPFALAATSSALDLAVISTHRLGSTRVTKRDAKADNDRLLTQLQALCLRSIAHLSGLSKRPDHGNLMLSPLSPDDLLTKSDFDNEQIATLNHNFELIADPRLEEVKTSARLSRFHFYFKSALINRHEIYAAVKHAKPWEFPLRLLRLSAAAISTMVVLMITAETWDLASKQPVDTLVTMVIITLITTICFVTAKQRLLVRSHSRQLREQSIITHISAILIVAIGMVTTALALISLSLLLSYLLYPPELVSNWANLSSQVNEHIVYSQTAIFVTSLSLFIGALGASFEEQFHFRHIVFIDEEL